MDQTRESQITSSIIETSPVPAPLPVINTVETDVVQRRKMKKLRKSIDDQLKKSDIKALKSHSSNCADIFDCSKDICFEREPDKIVGESYEVKK